MERKMSKLFERGMFGDAHLTVVAKKFQHYIKEVKFFYTKKGKNTHLTVFLCGTGKIPPISFNRKKELDYFRKIVCDIILRKEDEEKFKFSSIMFCGYGEGAAIAITLLSETREHYRKDIKDGLLTGLGFYMPRFVKKKNYNNKRYLFFSTIEFNVEKDNKLRKLLGYRKPGNIIKLWSSLKAKRKACANPTAYYGLLAEINI